MWKQRGRRRGGVQASGRIASHGMGLDEVETDRKRSDRVASDLVGCALEGGSGRSVPAGGVRAAMHLHTAAIVGQLAGLFSSSEGGGGAGRALAAEPWRWGLAAGASRRRALRRQADERATGGATAPLCLVC